MKPPKRTQDPHGVPAASDRLPHRCLVKLQGLYHTLKQAERKAADLLLASPESVAGTGIVDFASRAGCSMATVVRLAQRLGYDGYPDLRRDFTQPDTTVPYGDISVQDTPETVLRRVFANSVRALEDTLAAVDPAQYRAAVDAMTAASHLAFFGLGNAAVVAREAYHKFLRIGASAHTAEDPDLQLLILGTQLARGDLLVLISYSGESRPMLTLAQAARTRGIRVLSITNYPRSTLARQSDIVLLTAVFQEHVNGEIGSKRLAQLAVLESLYVNYLLRKGPHVRQTLAATHEALGIHKTRGTASP